MSNNVYNQMSRPSNSESENLQKDGLIASLKKELYELQDREHEFIPLENQVTNIESKFAMLQDEKERIESEHKMKIEMNRKTIVELRLEIDSIRMQIHKYGTNTEEIFRDIAGVKRVCENRENEIATLLTSNQEMNSKNEEMSEENKNKLMQIKTLKEDRNRMDADCQRIVKSLEDGINLLKMLEKEARSIEASNSKLTSILSVAEKDHTELIEEMKNREEVVTSTNKKLETLNMEIDQLREKTRKLEKDCLKSEQDHKSVVESLELMMLKNKEQAKKIKSLESELRLIENELDKQILAHDALQYEHSTLSAENQLLNRDIDTVFEQIAEYQKKNNQLQAQLQNYIRLDEQARALLNRREVMSGLLETVNRRLGQTADNISHLR